MKQHLNYYLDMITCSILLYFLMKSVLIVMKKNPTDPYDCYLQVITENSDKLTFVKDFKITFREAATEPRLSSLEICTQN